MIDDDERDVQTLLLKLKELSSRGPIPAVSNGANAVGKTLQIALEIEHNTTSRNCLLGHTVTATTGRINSSSRTNLFACVPNWQASLVDSSLELVELVGHENLARGYEKSLFCTVNSLSPNSFGLELRVDVAARRLEEWRRVGDQSLCLVQWDSARLFNKLEALNRTAIVTALVVKGDAGKFFHYRYVDLLGKPDSDSLFRLIDDGAITVDHCISKKVGGNTAREQGPLFKIRGDARDLFYSSIRRIDLMQP